METWSPGDRPVLLGGNLYSKNRWRLRWCVGATGAERVWVRGHRPRHHRSNHQRNDTANELDPRPVCLCRHRPSDCLSVKHEAHGRDRGGPYRTPCTSGCRYALNRRDLSGSRSEEHTSELQSRGHLVCRLLLDPPTTLLSLLSLHDALPI